MKEKFKYGPITHAINMLRKKGFGKDFSLVEGSIVYKEKEFKAKDLKISVIYRYEGDSDPADEATVYGLETISGLKGILVTGEGIYAEGSSSPTLKELHIKENQLFQYADR